MISFSQFSGLQGRQAWISSHMRHMCSVWKHEFFKTDHEWRFHDLKRRFEKNMVSVFFHTIWCSSDSRTMVEKSISIRRRQLVVCFIFFWKSLSLLIKNVLRDNFFTFHKNWSRFVEQSFSWEKNHIRFRYSLNLYSFELNNVHVYFEKIMWETNTNFLFILSTFHTLE